MRWDQEIRLVTADDPEGKKVDPRKFVAMTYAEQYGNRYGNSLYEDLYWYWWFKKNSVKFWAKYSERFASPITTIKGKFGKEDKAVIDRFLANMKNSPGIRLPDNALIDIIQAGISGAISYEKFIEYCDRRIALVILGQDSLVNMQKVGSYAADEVKDNVTRRDITGSDLLMLEEFINSDVIPPACDINVPGVKDYPQFRFLKGQYEYKEKELLIQIIETMNTKLKLPIEKKFIYEAFGMSIPQEGDETLEPNETPEPPPPGTEPKPPAGDFNEEMNAGLKTLFVKDLLSLGQ